MKKSSEIRPKTILEQLEPRIAPAGLTGIKYLDITLGTPQLLKTGQGLKANGMYLMAVTQGEALVYSTDINGNNTFNPNDITGIAAGDGLKLTSFVNINGDIVTDLQANGMLSSSTGSATNHDGLLLLNSKITAITLRSVTAADVPAGINYLTVLAPSTYSINGNIYAGGGVGDGVVGDGIVIDTAGTAAQATKFNGSSLYYQVSGIAPSIGSIMTGTAAGGHYFSFGYVTNQLGDAHAGSLQGGGILKAFTPGIGQAGGSISGLSVGNNASTDTTTTPSSPMPFTIGAIVAGNGGLGAAGGSISNITLDGDSGGLQVVAGNGGSGVTGGAGGSIVNLSDLGSVEGVVQIQTGSGGAGFTGAGGSAGTLSLGTFDMNGDVHVNLGNGGNGQTTAGAGSSLIKGTITPTNASAYATAVSLVTTYRNAGDIGTPQLIDFTGSGNTDAIFVTNSPNQIGIAFGQDGFPINSASPVLYLSDPGLSALTSSPSSDIVVGDFTNQYYTNADGSTYLNAAGNPVPILDIAVASNTANNTSGIEVFLNPATKDTLIGDNQTSNGWYLAAENGGSTGGNFLLPSIHVPLPMLNATGYLSSGAAVTSLVAGNFSNHPDGTLDLAYTTQVFQTNGGPVSYTSAVMLTGTGDGHFFADYAYNTVTGTQDKMPVLDAGQTGFNNQQTFSLTATAASQGNIHSDVLVLTGNSGIPTVHLIQFVQPAQSSLNTLYSGGELTSLSAMQPTYETAIIDNGAIIGWNTVLATPVSSVATDIAGGSGSVFDIVTLDQGQAITAFGGAWSQLSATTGIASLASDQGITLTADNHTLLYNTHVNFYGIAAGDFGGTTPAQFALYTSAVSTSNTPTAFYQFDLSSLTLHTANSYFGAGLAKNGSVRAPSPLYGYNSAIVAFGVYSAQTSDATLGYISAMPTTNGDGFIYSNYSFLIQIVGNATVNGFTIPYAYDALGLNSYALALTAGNGGNSTLGSGGAGGILGVGSATTKTASVSIVLPTMESYQPFVSLSAGTGGSGLTNGGAGGGLQGLGLSYAGNNTTEASSFNLYAQNGGAGLFGSGGNGGGLSGLQVQSGEIFTAGNGGSGYRGGTGGVINGSAGVNGYTANNDFIYLTSGSGGSGIASGGAGGAITGFATEFPVQFGGAEGLAQYIAGSGGSAVAGTGGAGGAIINDSPISTNNNLQGPITLQAGAGGNGLSGGAGGAVSNFSSQSTAGTIVTAASILAGNGGTGITGAGGTGGAISSIYASALGTDATNGYQFNRIIAGNGGNSYGAVGGTGGSVTGVTSTAQSSSVVAAAGAGGDGLTRGGAGGSLVSATLDSANSATAKVLAIAGAGGNAYGALSSASNVADTVNGITDTNLTIIALRAFGNANGIGGNGGSITGFTQPKSVASSVDMIAGNGGSVMNYGFPADSTSNVGIGGSITNTILAGNAGNTDASVAIVAYNTGTTTISDFVQNTLVAVPSTQITDTLGNVGVVVGVAGSLKDGLPAGNTLTKTGSVISFSASSIMSMVAGSVDNIAQINTLSGVTSSTDVYGSYKTEGTYYDTSTGTVVFTAVPHADSPLYVDSYEVDPNVVSNQSSSPLAGGALMDGTIYANNVGGLTGPRVF